MNTTRRLLIPLLREALKKPSTSKRQILIGSSLAASAAVGTAVYVSKLDSIEDLTEIGIIRFGRAASTVANIVIDYKTSVRGIAEPSEEYNKAMRGCHRRSAERLLTLARDNGGVFIKVGQHIAALEYLVPPEYTEILSVLMSNAPQQSLKDIRFVLEREFAQPMEDVFSNFSDKPVGAASLAQVHVAILKETGEKVAVKVQHRRVYENSKTDMKTMEFLVNVADILFPEFKLFWLVEEVKKNLPNELDFLHEARNADRARERFSHLSFLKIPHIHYEHSTNRVLTMEFCEGAQINDREYIAANNIDKSDLCRKLGKLISEMIFMKGYLHSDTHPGNVLVYKTPAGETQVVLLDHGLYLDVDDNIRSMYSDLWLSLLNADQQGIKRAAKDMGVGELYGLFACMVAKRSWKSVTEGIGSSPLNRSEQKELQQYAFSLLPQISEVLSRMPREMLLILKTNDLLRNMEYILECQTRQDSMIEVTKCVVRSHHELALQKTDKRLKRICLQLSMCWSLFRIRIYELYLRFSDNFGYRI